MDTHKFSRPLSRGLPSQRHVVAGRSDQTSMSAASPPNRHLRPVLYIDGKAAQISVNTIARADGPGIKIPWPASQRRPARHLARIPLAAPWQLCRSGESASYRLTTCESYCSIQPHLSTEARQRIKIDLTYAFGVPVPKFRKAGFHVINLGKRLSIRSTFPTLIFLLRGLD